MAEHVNEAFTWEARERIDRGSDFVSFLVDSKKKDKTLTAKAALDAFVQKHPGPRMILTPDLITKLRPATVFPNQADIDLLTKGAMVASNVTVVSLVQEYVSSKAKQNASRPLPNPMTRIAMNFHKTTGMPEDNLTFYDKKKPFKADGKQQYEKGMVQEGDKSYHVNADNVHKFILSQSLIDGIVNMDSVCYSNMGISIPVKANVLIVEQRESRSFGLDDVYGDDDEDYGTAPVKTVPDASADEKNSKPESMGADELDGLLEGLSDTGVETK